MSLVTWLFLPSYCLQRNETDKINNCECKSAQRKSWACCQRPLSQRRQDWCRVLRMRTLQLTVKGEGELDRKRCWCRDDGAGWLWVCAWVLGGHKQLKENTCYCKADVHWGAIPNRSASLGCMEVSQHGHTRNSLPREGMSSDKFKAEDRFYSLHLRAA